jgi:hypothetical protein
MGEAARRIAFSPEEALAYLRCNPEGEEAPAGRAPAAGRECRIETAAEVARGMREFLEERASRWP